MLLRTVPRGIPSRFHSGGGEPGGNLMTLTAAFYCAASDRSSVERRNPGFVVWQAAVPALLMVLGRSGSPIFDAEVLVEKGAVALVCVEPAVRSDGSDEVNAVEDSSLQGFGCIME